jgi:hypothetical protein
MDAPSPGHGFASGAHVWLKPAYRYPLFGIAALTVPAIAQEQAFYYAE